MTDQQITDRATTNGKSVTQAEPKVRKPREWKDIPDDPLAEGFDAHQADYVVGKNQVAWDTLKPGQLFSRSKSGKNLYVKLNDGRAICLDTRQPIEIKPVKRNNWPVWLVTSFNSTTASKVDH